LAGIDRNWITLRNADQLRVVMPHYSGGNGDALVSTATQALITGFSIFVGGICGALTGLVAKLTGPVTHIRHMPQRENHKHHTEREIKATEGEGEMGEMPEIPEM